MDDNGTVNDLPAPERNERKSGGFSLRKILWISGGAAVLLIALAAVLFVVRDAVVAAAVTRVGSYFTGTAVTLDSFDSSLSGRIELRGLRVGNPAGYHNKHAFSLDRVCLHLVPGTLFSERIELKEISVSGMRVAYEPVLDGSNLQDIQQHLEEVTGAEDSETADAAAPEKEPEAKPDEAGKQVVIRLLSVDDYAVTLASPAIKTSFTVPLPPVRMTDVGDGRPLADTLTQLYNEMLKSVFTVLNSAGGAVASALGDAAKASASGVSAVGNTVVSSFDGAVRSAGDGMEAAGKHVAESVGGIWDGILDGASSRKSAKKMRKAEKIEKKSKNNLQK